VEEQRATQMGATTRHNTKTMARSAREKELNEMVAARSIESRYGLWRDASSKT
jgi:hypothetical protein